MGEQKLMMAGTTIRKTLTAGMIFLSVAVGASDSGYLQQLRAQYPSVPDANELIQALRGKGPVAGAESSASASARLFSVDGNGCQPVICFLPNVSDSNLYPDPQGADSPSVKKASTAKKKKHAKRSKKAGKGKGKTLRENRSGKSGGMVEESPKSPPPIKPAEARSKKSSEEKPGKKKPASRKGG